MSAEYMRTTELADFVGVKKRTFHEHVRHNVGGIKSAQVKVPGLGLRYDTKKARRYIALTKRKIQPV